MKKWLKILSAYLALFFAIGTCSLLGHHVTSDHSHHHQHAHHSAETDTCEIECSCQQVASIPIETDLVTDTSLAMHWSIDQITAVGIVQQTVGYTLARDGPLFEQARVYAREIVMRT